MIEFFYDCSSPWTYLGFESIEKLGAELEVVRVVPERWRFVSRPSLEDEAGIEERRRLHHQLRSWLVDALGEAGRFVRILVAPGDFVEQVAQRVRAGHAVLPAARPGGRRR